MGMSRSFLEMEFTIRRVGPEDLSQIDDWIQHKFLPAMPLMTAFGVDTTQRLPSPHGPTQGSVDVYLLAVDTRGTTVGVAVAKETVVFQEDPHASPEWNRMVEFMTFIEQDAKLHELPGGTMELLVLSVAEQWRRRGVAGRLVLEAEAAAKDAGLAAILVCCTSEYAARAARGAGWREHYRLAYRDYPGLSGRDVKLTPTPPHQHVYFYIKEL